MIVISTAAATYRDLFW